MKRNLSGHETQCVLLITNLCFQTTWATFLYFSYLCCFRTLVLTLNCSVFLSNLGFLLTVFSYTQDMKGEQLFCPLCHHFSRLGSLSLNWKGRLSINLIIIFTTSALLNIGPVTPYLNRQVSIIFPHLYLLIKLPFIKMRLFLISKSRTCIFFFFLFHYTSIVSSLRVVTSQMICQATFLAKISQNFVPVLVHTSCFGDKVIK